MNKEKSAIYKLIQYSKEMMDFVFKLGEDRIEKLMALADGILRDFQLH